MTRFHGVATSSNSGSSQVRDRRFSTSRRHVVDLWLRRSQGRTRLRREDLRRRRIGHTAGLQHGALVLRLRRHVTSKTCSPAGAEVGFGSSGAAPFGVRIEDLRSPEGRTVGTVFTAYPVPTVRRSRVRRRGPSHSVSEILNANILIYDTATRKILP